MATHIPIPFGSQLAGKAYTSVRDLQLPSTVELRRGSVETKGYKVHDVQLDIVAASEGVL